MDIDGTDTRIQKYILELDEQGKYIFSEVPMNYRYVPSEELKTKLSRDKMGILKYTIRTYYADLKKGIDATKSFRIQKAEFKEQLQRRKDFAKANRQFIEEEKDKSYVYEKDGRKIVVKNVEYEEVGGKKLQKIAIIENSEQNKRRKAEECTRFCYMDEFNIGDIEPEVATEYFFNNLDKINEKQSSVPEYIGLPLQNLETGEVTNEYDTVVDKNFRQYIERRQESKDLAEKNFAELKNSKKLSTKIKLLFSKVFGRKKDVVMLDEGKIQNNDRANLASMGYSSVKAMNADDKEAEMYRLLSNQLNDDLGLYSFNEENKNQRSFC